MLTGEQKKLLIEMKDNRAVDISLLKAFTEESKPLYGFWKFSTNKNDLIICFRGNQKAIEIYYLNHVVWKLTPGSKGLYKVIFNFGHANGMPDRDEILEKLCTVYGFSLMSDKKNIVCERDNFPETFVTEEFWLLFKRTMDFCFDPKNGAPKIEKRWQQKFFNDFHNEKFLNGGLYIYDLEYQQKMPNLPEIKEILGDFTAEELIKRHLRSVELRKDIASCSNEPDFLGIEFDEKGEGKYLVFGEIKSLYESCGGSDGEKKSGINEHLRRMCGYLEMKELIEKRKEDAEKILEQYKIIGDISQNKSFSGIAKNLEIKNVLVLTNSDYVVGSDRMFRGKEGGAIRYYNEPKHKTVIEKLAKEAKCEIWLVDGCCDQQEALTMGSIKRVKMD